MKGGCDKSCDKCDKSKVVTRVSQTKFQEICDKWHLSQQLSQSCHTAQSRINKGLLAIV
uniref:Uncharacterized protein n=1 Tax=Siphoviridae sp. ctr0N4 TaxID=2826473 RepID=A0A8S5M050_9CAUD|nr:MAG TPA: hypothetical protein [Siphoviridae sp. ctr0N4]